MIFENLPANKSINRVTQQYTGLMQETSLPGLGSPLSETIETTQNELHSANTRHRCNSFFSFFFEITIGRHKANLIIFLCRVHLKIF